MKTYNLAHGSDATGSGASVLKTAAPIEHGAGLSPAQAGLLAGLLCIVGAFAVFPTVRSLWSLWTSDPLKSIGGFIPLVSLFLILRAWRALGWTMNGSWWGLALLAAIVGLVHLREVAILEFVVTPTWAIVLPPYSVVAVVYAAGAVILFGGWRLLARTRFPVLLMWFVDPVPAFFTRHIDLPMQHASSLIARGFAHALGQQLTPDQLLLMFTPQFGMFIAPGCNGIRGAITMGMIALVAGYLYRFKPWVTATVVTGAVLLGYVFNLARLCSLVLYYLLALHIPWLQSRATMGDYIIGASLFFFATILLFTLIQKLGPTGDLWPPALVRETDGASLTAPRSFYLRWAAFAMLVALGSVGYARALAQQGSGSAWGDRSNAIGPFPEQIGNFHLKERWAEAMTSGPIVFYWADYADDQGNAVSLAVSPILGAHDAMFCRSARGEDWSWNGGLNFSTRTGTTSFAGFEYIETQRQVLDATTLCTGDTCGQFANERTRLGLVYSRPSVDALLNPSPNRPIPVMVRAATDNMQQTPEQARKQLTQQLNLFLAAVDLDQITQPYRKP